DDRRHASPSRGGFASCGLAGRHGGRPLQRDEASPVASAPGGPAKPQAAGGGSLLRSRRGPPAGERPRGPAPAPAALAGGAALALVLAARPTRAALRAARLRHGGVIDQPGLLLLGEQDARVDRDLLALLEPAHDLGLLVVAQPDDDLALHRAARPLDE